MKSKAFTLIEVIVATFIITVGIGGVFALIQKTISDTSLLADRLTATYLAQEGIEIVKNIRDTNFLKIYEGSLTEEQWTQDLTGCEGGCEADYTDFALLTNDRYLKIEGGFYKYSASGIETSFKRKITITPDTDKLEVLVEVLWEERGNIHQVAAQENVYKWW
jgi:hypothetical protein